MAAENSTKRVPGRPFKPGQSGNPGGRPKDEIRVKELAREHTVEALQALVTGLKAKGERTRIAAAEALLDRGWGRPTQHHEVDARDDLTAALDRAWARVNKVDPVDGEVEGAEGPAATHH